MSKSKAVKGPEVVETHTVVEKLTMREYALVELTIHDDVVVERKVLKKDLPIIILSHLVQGLRKQGFVDAATRNRDRK